MVRVKRTYQLLSFTEQDKLEARLLKTKEGDYIEISPKYIFYPDEQPRFASSIWQGELVNGLINLPKHYNKPIYYPIDSIKRVEELGIDYKGLGKLVIILIKSMLPDRIPFTKR
jgi:hypothetical protein